MTQFYSRNDVNYSGDVYSIPFDYIDKKEVKVYIDDELWTKWHFLSEHQLTLDEVPEDIKYSNIISVRRETDIEDKVVTYDNNSLLNKENLNKSQDQLLHAVQEIYDNNTQFAIDVNEYNEQFAADITNYNEQFARDIRAEVDAKVEAVSDAVEKLEFLEDSVEIANEAALAATEQAEIVEQANINIQSVFAETEAVLQEAKDTLGDTLNKSQITNCLLEVPQNIKLELNDGKLTLKAGSKVIVPNGAGVFDEVVITSDKTRTISTTNETFLYYKDGVLGERNVNSSTSGATQPTQTYGLWYDTTNNIVKSSTGGDFTGSCSLPIARIANGVIDQVFNGFGYIGSTVWVDKGVKELIPNGRNEDGTLNNIEFTSPRVTTRTFPNNETYSKIYLGLTDRNTIGRLPDNVYSFDVDKNYIDNAWVVGDPWMHGVFATCTLTNGVISNFQPKLPVRLLTYDDIKINNPYFFGQYIWSEFAPSNLSWLKSSGQWNSGSGYQAFYDWALANANANKAGFKLSTASYTDYDFVVNTSAKTFRLPIKVKGKMGESVVGTGIALGLTTGVANFGLGKTGNNSNHSFIGVNTTGYGIDVGKDPGGAWANTGNITAMGVTTDPTKSGIELDSTGLSLYFYVGETTRDTGLINASQIASNFADKIGRTECKAYITETYSSGTSWYRVYSDGWCEQGGLITGATKISLLKPFIDANYTVVASANIAFYDRTTTYLNITDVNVGDSSKPNPVGWQACGYIS